jgi:hypothetical protein
MMSYQNGVGFNSGCDPDFGSCWSYQITGRASRPVANPFRFTALSRSKENSRTYCRPPTLGEDSGAFRGCLPRFRPLLLYYIHAYTSLHTSLYEMKQLLDLLGSLFVYRSPTGLQGFRAGLMQLSNRQLQPLADTKSHVKKSVLVDRIIADMK